MAITTRSSINVKPFFLCTLPLLSYPTVLVLFIDTNPQGPVDIVMTFQRHRISNIFLCLHAPKAESSTSSRGFVAVGQKHRSGLSR
jgi:hypothetical protein